MGEVEVFEADDGEMGMRYIPGESVSTSTMSTTEIHRQLTEMRRQARDYLWDSALLGLVMGSVLGWGVFGLTCLFLGLWGEAAPGLVAAIFAGWVWIERYDMEFRVPWRPGGVPDGPH